MKVVLYSGGDQEDNHELNLNLIRLIGKSNPSVTFIPSSFDDANTLFEEFVDLLSPYGVRDFFVFPVDTPSSSKMMRKAFERDLVFLSGGNTFYFLKHLRKSKALGEIKKFVERGGVLAGLSAGAIITTPNINMASYPEFDKDENIVDLKNLKALGLSSFEFFPHYANSRRYNDALKEYSKDNGRPLYALPDGSGIVIQGESISFIGDTYLFLNGQRMKF